MAFLGEHANCSVWIFPAVLVIRVTKCPRGSANLKRTINSRLSIFGSTGNAWIKVWCVPDDGQRATHTQASMMRKPGNKREHFLSFPQPPINPQWKPSCVRYCARSWECKVPTYPQGVCIFWEKTGNKWMYYNVLSGKIKQDKETRRDMGMACYFI